MVLPNELRAPRKRSRRPTSFYAAVLARADRAALARARTIQGLDEETAFLRAAFRAGLLDRPLNLRQNHRTMELLLKAIALRERLVAASREPDMADAVAAVLKHYQGVLFPEGGEQDP